MSGSEIVNRLSAVLADRGVPKTKFYKECGITSGAISQWKTGKTAPSRKALEKICAYLNCSIKDLTDDDYYGILVLEGSSKTTGVDSIVNTVMADLLGETKTPAPEDRDGLVDALYQLRDEERALLAVTRDMTPEQVGHANATTTLNVYTHLRAQKMQRSRAAIDAYFSPSDGTNDGKNPESLDK